MSTLKLLQFCPYTCPVRYTGDFLSKNKSLEYSKHHKNSVYMCIKIHYQLFRYM